MSDKHGLTLQAGDPVILEDEVTATVLRHLGSNRYLVQLDPRNALVPRVPQVQDMLRHIAVDVQEPLEVAGERLVFVGKMDGTDDDFDDDDDDD